MQAAALKTVTSSAKTGGSDNWSTPSVVFAAIQRRFAGVSGFNLDAAASKDNAKCLHYYDEALNGLEQPWRGNVFINPPYSGVADWIAKGLKEYRERRIDKAVFLVPARTDTRWFHTAVVNCADVFLLKGRIKFESSALNHDVEVLPNLPKVEVRQLAAKSWAPFPSCVIYIGPSAIRNIRVADWRTW